MKNLLYYLSIVFMLIACNVKEHRDGINNHGESSSTADSSTAKSQIKILQPITVNYNYSRAQTDPLDTCIVSFSRYDFGHTLVDTLLDGIPLRYNCIETQYPEDYIFSGISRETNVYGEFEPITLIAYGNRASIMWGKSDRSKSYSDTLLITRKLLADVLIQMGIFEEERTKYFELSDLNFKEMRNDSLIFNLKFIKPDGDILYGLELKFDKDSRDKTFTITDITDQIWTFGDDDDDCI